MTRVSIFLIPLALIVSHSAWPAYYAPNLPPSAGTISHFFINPNGEVDGFVLNDEQRTVAKFPPELFRRSGLHIHDAVTVTGLQILSSPNVVLEKVTVWKGDAVVLHDYPGRPKGPKRDKAYKRWLASTLSPETASGRVFAVSAKRDGRIDKVMLEDGTSIHFPKKINRAETYLRDQKVSFSGWGKIYGGVKSLKIGAPESSPQVSNVRWNFRGRRPSGETAAPLPLLPSR